MRRRLRCHRLLAYHIACRQIAGPTILVPSPRHLSQKQKFAAPCTYGEFSDAKKNVGVLLVAVLGCATSLVSSYLATKVITAAYICRSTRSCGPEVHESVYRYTYNVDLTTPNALSSYRIYNIHSTFELPVYLPLTPPSKHQRGICVTLLVPGRSSRVFTLWLLAGQAHSVYGGSLCCSTCSETSHRQYLLRWHPGPPLHRLQADPSLVPFASG